MKLLTRELMEKIPVSQEGKGDEAIVHAKFFTPWAGWTWYVTEAVAILEDDSEVPLNQVNGREVQDIRFFGLVDGLERELGYFSMNELQSVRGPAGLAVERDKWWEPAPLKSI